MNRVKPQLYPLSPMQEGMLYQHLLKGPPGLNVLVVSAALRGLIDSARFGAAWNLVLNRHDLLGCSFHWKSAANPYCKVVSNEGWRPIIEDWTEEAYSTERERKLEQRLQAERHTRFSLQNAPLVRVSLLRFGEADWRLIWTLHHILLDGLALSLVLEEVFKTYEAMVSESDLGLSSRPSFQDYLSEIHALDHGAEDRFWQRTLQGFVKPNRITTGSTDPPPMRDLEHFVEIEAYLDSERTRALDELAVRLKVTTNTLIETVWSILVGTLSQREDVVFGIARGCRNSLQLAAEAVIGPIVNVLPLRLQLSDHDHLSDLVAQARKAHTTQQEFEHTSLQRIQAHSEVPRGTPLFESAILYERVTKEMLLEQACGDYAAGAFRVWTQSNYPLVLSALHDRGRLLLRLGYYASHLEPAQVAAMLTTVVELLSASIRTANPKVEALRALASATIRAPNHSRGDLPLSKARDLFAAFHEVARSAPDAIALSWGNTQLSYRELDRRARHLAARLSRCGIRCETPVGVCLPRSADFVVAILAILRAGGTYVPMDPNYPVERLQWIARDAGLEHCLTQGTDLPWLTVLNLQTIDVSQSIMEETVLEPSPRSSSHPDSLAYVIYTSGSTGLPKGVAVTHSNVLGLLQGCRARLDTGPEERWLQFHSTSFDFSVWEIWGALLSGGRIEVLPERLSYSPDELHDFILKRGVTMLSQTPSAFYRFSDVDARTEPCALPLRYVIFGGEALSGRRLSPWIARHGLARPLLVNMYGITETTVHVTARIWSSADEEHPEQDSIGTPLPLYDLDLRERESESIARNSTGELSVGGVGVSRGYLHRPALTAERFVPDDFGPPGARRYRSGDLGRRLPDGTYGFAGRMDQQIKVRGFRVEPAEIEAKLLEASQVAEACVIAIEGIGGEQSLAAFVVPRAGEHLVLESLRRSVQESLPSYMVPSTFTLLEGLPRHPNGKLDRNQLSVAPPSRERWPTSDKRQYSSTEQLISGVWKEVLEVEDLGLHDNFFDLGGHSGLLVQVLGRLNGKTSRRLTVVDLLRYPTIAALANRLEERETIEKREGSSEASETPSERANAQQALFQRRQAAQRKSRRKNRSE